MINNIHSLKAKQAIIALVLIITWQFTFPQPVFADENTNKDYNPIIQRFEEQWSIDTYPNQNLIFRLPAIADKPQPEAKKIMNISVTAYSSTPDQTQGDPFITASGTRVHDGTLAANFLPIGTKVRFPDYFGTKIFVVEDRMSARYWHKADIWMATRQEAKDWGVRYIQMEIL